MCLPVSFLRSWWSKKRDSAGYVTALTADGNWLEGETFRQGMHLASADFSVQKVGKNGALFM